MPTANIITSQLPAYVKELEPVLIDQVAVQGPTIDRMAIQTGIKKSAYLNILDVRPELQAGTGCGFTPQGEIELTDRALDVALIKINMDLCPENLRGVFAEYLVRSRAGEPPMPFEEQITNAIVAFIQEALEKAIWLGDTASLDPNLANFDGLLKIADNEAGTVKPTITATTWRGVVAQVLAVIPAAARKRGAVIHMDPAAFEGYLLELVNANLYHYSGPQNEAPAEFVVPGTNVRVVRTEGLEGSGYVFASYDRNLYYGTDMENDKEVFSITYDEKDEIFMIKVRWTSGVQIAFPDRVVLADISGVTIGASAPVAEAVMAIAECVCDAPHSTVSSLELDAENEDVQLNGTYQVYATTVPGSEDANTRWEILDETIATIDQTTGASVTVTGVAEGTTILIARNGDKEAYCIINVVQ